MGKSKPGNWSDEDDTALAQLFRSKKVSATDLHKDTLHKVNDKYFPIREFKNFSPLFKAKAAQWSLNKYLTGRRKKSK